MLSSLVALALVAGDAPRAADGEAPVDFARDVRPILSDHCYQCHGPDPRTREAGLRLDTREGALAALPSGAHAVVAGDTDESELVYRLDPLSEDERMPPESAGKPLDERERSILIRWVEEGAVWGEHWSFQAPASPEPPRADVDPIDAFVSASLADAGLGLRPEAEPETLLRRVSLDLVGLPPSLDERDAFLADVGERGLDDAYRSVVDRLLDSERYGVHMARPWLDAARYADTHGLHLDNRRSMWPYRDWVVNAFNENKPFDEFTVEQLAGDLLPNATVQQRIASGFNRCNPTSAEGGMIAEEYLSIYAKDRVDTTATVWLGLTMACAQCHDHKYDPLSQRDYYSMLAFFNSLSEEATDRNVENPAPFVRVASVLQQAALDAFDAEEDALTAALERPDPELEAQESEWLDAKASDLGRAWKVLIPEAVAAENGVTLEVDPLDGTVSASGENPASTAYVVDAWVPPGAVAGVRLDALVPEGARLPGRADNENFVMTSFRVLARRSGTDDEYRQIGLADAAATHEQPGFPIASALDPAATNGWAGLGQEGDRSALFAPSRPFGHAEGTDLRVELRFDSFHERHALARFRLAVRREPTPPRLFASDWRLASFTAESPDDLYERPFPPDGAIAGGIDVEGEAAPGVPWTPRPDLVEGRAHSFDGTFGAHYLVQGIESDRAQRVELRLGSDDGVEVWLNGTSVHVNRVARGAAPDQDRVALDLRSGANQLVVKVVNTGGLWGFAWSLVDANGDDAERLPPALELALQRPRSEWSDDDRREARLQWRLAYAPRWAARYEEREQLRRERRELTATLATTLVSAELEMRRPAYVLERGAYDRPGDQVEPSTPSVLPPFPADAPRNRLGLARWLVAPENPLTARVWVNRAWQHFFGRGLVATPEDFGAQGEWPSHPDLLDWLAETFVASGWNVKDMHRRIVTSRTYRQDAAVNAGLLEADPDNRLLSRAPRIRLDAETLRDQALYVSGLLDETMGGPGVRPYQPDGVWFAVGYSRSNTVRYEEGPQDHLHRRSLYTFWKRTAPPPNLTIFDAPMRDACVVLRERTNTPLQALVTLNDPTYVEAAEFLAARVLREVADDPARIERLIALVLSREPTSLEAEKLLSLASDLEASYEAEPASAVALVGAGDLPVPHDVDVIELAAWTVVASTILNLDEALTKE